MTDIIVNNLLGILFGIFSSLLSWWILFHKIAPKIKFSYEISKITKENSELYRVKMKNTGFRNIIDIDIYPKLVIGGQYPGLPDNFSTVVLRTNLDDNKISRLKAKSSIVFTIEAHFEKPPKTLKFPDTLIEKIKLGDLTLEDLLSINNDAYLLIEMLCYDEFSGSRKIFESDKYTISSIKKGKFDTKKAINKSGLCIILDTKDNK